VLLLSQLLLAPCISIEASSNMVSAVSAMWDVWAQQHANAGREIYGYAVQVVLAPAIWARREVGV